MIVPFAVEPEALAMPAADRAVRRAVHRRLLELWSELGVLVHDGQAFRDSELAGAIRQLPVDVRKLWETAIERNRRRGVSRGWRHLREIGSAEELAGLQAHIRLACLDPARAVRLGLPDGRESMRLTDADLEICRLDCADQAEAFQRARRLAREGIATGARVEQVWAERFADLARTARHVVVVDRYAAQRHAGGKGEPTGLQALLTRLSAGQGEKRVTLYTARRRRRTEPDGAGAVAALAGGMDKGGIRELRLYLASDQDFRAHAHDRFIRFDNAVVELGSGLEVLEGPIVGRACSFSLKAASAITRDAETALRAVSAERVFAPGK